MILDYRTATRIIETDSSIIGNVLKYSKLPGIISFAGGLPSHEAFPVSELHTITDKVYKRFSKDILQYGVPEGYAPLRNFITQRLKRKQYITDFDEVQIVSGSQQGIDLVSKIFLDKGDSVIIENPSYLSAFPVFNCYGANYLAVSSDADGLNIIELEEKLRKAKQVKLLYIVPTFQNPTGVSLILERRKKLLNLASNYDFYIIEDDPYSELRYDGNDLPTLKSMDTEGRVIYIGSFSKLVAPGLRVGFMAMPKALRKKITFMKQASDVHNCNLSQYIVHEFCCSGYLDNHIDIIKRNYKARRDTMLAALERYFPKKINWNRPEGGIFIWVELPSHNSSIEILNNAIQNGIAFVPGKPFFVDNSGVNTLRLNFTGVEINKIEVGIHRLANAVSNV